MKKILKDLLDILRRYPVYARFRRGVKSMMATCELKPLTGDQKREIRTYYKSTLGKNTKLYWHQFYYSMNGIFSVKYIPNDLYFGYIKNKLFDNNICAAYDDKNLYDKFFPDTRQPKIFLKCVDGHYSIDNLPVGKEEAIIHCSNLQEAIIKPTFLSAGGENVRYFSTANGIEMKSKKTVREVFDTYGKNFNVQEAIHQHPALARLNPTSVNTIRVVTYFRENEVVLLYAVMRIGEEGSDVDNTTDGGYTCGIQKDGKLKKYAYGFNPAKSYTSNPAGLTFENYPLPQYEQVVAEAKRLHYQMPHLLMIGWDFTVNDDNEPVFIEMNAPCGLHQSAAGPAFGEYTDEILKKCSGR